MRPRGRGPGEPVRQLEGDDVPDGLGLDQHRGGHEHHLNGQPLPPGEGGQGRREQPEEPPAHKHHRGDAPGVCPGPRLPAPGLRPGLQLHRHPPHPLRGVHLAGALVRPGPREGDRVLHVAQAEAGPGDRRRPGGERRVGRHIRARGGLPVLRGARVLPRHHGARGTTHCWLIRRRTRGAGVALGHATGTRHRRLRLHRGQRRRHRRDERPQFARARDRGRPRRRGLHRQRVRDRLGGAGELRAAPHLLAPHEGGGAERDGLVLLHGPLPGRHAAVRLQRHHHEVGRQGCVRHGRGVPAAVPEDHQQLPEAGLRPVHQDLHRGVAEGDVPRRPHRDRCARGRRPVPREEGHCRSTTRFDCFRRADGHQHDQHRRGLGQRQEVRHGERPERFGAAQELGHR
mmetsp:Transcript_13002/g.36885  ORF Transcript_13002/g.36885 Transcript_13002/m.36885 type:complete len:400 (-) Transcript_13002:260-1459(-)